MYGAITFICCQTGGVFLSSAARISRSTMPPSLSAGAFDLEDVPTRARDEATHHKRASGGLGFQEEEFDYKRRRFDEPPPEPVHYQPAPPMLPISPFLGYPPRADFQRGPVSGETSPSIVASSILGSMLSTSLPHMQQRDRPYEFNGQNYATDSSGSNASSPGLAPATMGYYPPPLSSYATSYAYAPAHPLSQSASFGPVPIPNRIVPPPLPSYAAPPSAPVEVVARIAEIKEEKRLPRRKAAPTDLKTGGVKACLSCGSVNSPEWRKGSDGTKSLCNACGTYTRPPSRYRAVLISSIQDFVTRDQSLDRTKPPRRVRRHHRPSRLRDKRAPLDPTRKDRLRNRVPTPWIALRRSPRATSSTPCPTPCCPRRSTMSRLSQCPS